MSATQSAATGTTTAATEPITVQIDERALLARVNRALAKNNMHLKKCRRDSSAYRKLGEYYLVSFGESVQIVEIRVDLVEKARQLSVLEAYEQLGTTQS